MDGSTDITSFAGGSADTSMSAADEKIRSEDTFFGPTIYRSTSGFVSTPSFFECHFQARHLIAHATQYTDSTRSTDESFQRISSSEDTMNDFFTYAHDDSAGSWIEDAARDLAQHDILELASLPEKNPEPILELSVDGSLTFCNAAARRDFPGILVSGFDHPVLEGMYRIIDRLSAGQIDELTREVTVDDSVYEQRFVFNTQSRRTRIFHRDITRVKTLERENMELRRLVDVLRYEMFQNAKTVENEIRAELGIVHGYAELLLESTRADGDLDTAELQRYITSAGERIENILEESSLLMNKRAPVPCGDVDIALFGNFADE